MITIGKMNKIKNIGWICSLLVLFSVVAARMTIYKEPCRLVR